MEEKLTQQLIAKGLVNEDQLKEAVKEKNLTGERLPSVLVKLGYISESKLLAILSNIFRIEVVDLDGVIPQESVLGLVPAEKAYSYEILPIERMGKKLTVAMVDPSNISALEDLRFITGMDITPILASEQKLREALERYYKMRKEVVAIKEEETRELDIEDMEILEAGSLDQEESVEQLQADAAGGPVIKLVNFYIADAVTKAASDIHIECFEKEIRVRFRVDGVLREQTPPPFNLRAGITTRSN